MNPFTVLGLPTSLEVTDARVRDAWRAIAAATHPDRPDGGNAARYTAATTAYAQLRTAWGRSEAYADLAAEQPPVPDPATRPHITECPPCPRGPAGPGPDPARPALASAGPRPDRRAVVPAGNRSAAGAASRSGRGNGPGHLVSVHRARGPGPATRPVRGGMPWCAAGDFLATSRLRASRGDPCGRPAGQHRGQQPSCPARPDKRRACRPPTRSPPPAGHRPNNHPPLPPRKNSQPDTAEIPARTQAISIPGEKRKAAYGL